MAASYADDENVNGDTTVPIITSDIAEKFRENPQVINPTLKDPFVGNVSWYTPMPPELAAHPIIIKGQLTFDACFENGTVKLYCIMRCYGNYVPLGNLGRVDYISEFEYDLFIRPDTCNPK